MIEFFRLFGVFLSVGIAITGICLPTVLLLLFSQRLGAFFQVLRYKKLYPDVVKCSCSCLTCKYLSECAISLREEVVNEFINSKEK